MSNTYDPNKQYQWKEQDEFVMDGNQFGLILNAFRNYLAKTEAQETMLIMKAETVMTTLLKEGVESGMINEMVTEKPAPPPQTTKKKATPKRKLAKT